MKQLLLALNLIFGSFASQAYALDRCDQMEIFNKQIENYKSDLEKFEGLHLAKIEADKISKILIDPYNEALVLNEKQKKIKELALETENGIMARNVTVASTGSLMLFSYIIWRMNRDTRGQALLRRMTTQLFPKDRKFKRHFSTAALIMSAAHLGWFGYRYLKINGKKEELKNIIDDLDKIADLSGKINSINENIEDISIRKEMLMEELSEDNLITVDGDSKVICKKES